MSFFFASLSGDRPQLCLVSWWDILLPFFEMFFKERPFSWSNETLLLSPGVSLYNCPSFSMCDTYLRELGFLSLDREVGFFNLLGRPCRPSFKPKKKLVHGLFVPDIIPTDLNNFYSHMWLFLALEIVLFTFVFFSFFCCTRRPLLHPSLTFLLPLFFTDFRAI